MSSNDSQRGTQNANDKRNAAAGSATATSEQHKERDSVEQQSRTQAAGQSGPRGQPGQPSTQSGRTTAQGQHTASGTDDSPHKIPGEASTEVSNESSQALGVGSSKYDSGKQTHR